MACQIGGSGNAVKGHLRLALGSIAATTALRTSGRALGKRV